ncbi:hypothetical protein [uncultured Ruminococcus sp.]|uniref:hypothetical protein n=1 Tax=uncultured Ruminococcus sp. TaxID=165186 RepID=UPI0025F913F8|nr:hypothetical protein [uncultured Ruminococcus sp.]
MDTKWIVFWALFIPVLIYKPIKKAISSRADFNHKQRAIRYSKGLDKVCLIIREDARLFFAMTDSRCNTPLFHIIKAYTTFVDCFYSSLVEIYGDSIMGMPSALKRYFNNFGVKVYEHKNSKYRYKYSARIYGFIFGLLLVKNSTVKRCGINRKKAISFLSNKVFLGECNEYATKSFNRCLLYVSELNSLGESNEKSKYEIKIAVSFLGLNAKDLNKYHNLESALRTSFATATLKALNEIDTSSIDDLISEKFIK